MIHVFHTPTGWKVCQEYPWKEYDFCDQGDCGLCDEICDIRREKYNQAVALSIANAVDVREEDQEWVKRKVFFRGNYFPLPDMEESEQELKDWKPNDNQVYALPELEMRIKEHCQHKGIHNSACIYSKLAHVFRKKEESDGQTNLEQYHDATGRITREEFDKMEESQEDLWVEVAYNFSITREFKDAYKTLQSKFHLTRVKAELKGEKK